MREWCSCGAAFHSLSPHAVKDWRANHFHDGKPDPEPDKEGSFASTERRGQVDYDGPISYKASFGFQPNEIGL